MEASERVKSYFNKVRLISFYRKHDPDMLAKIDTTLEENVGKEDALFSKLEEKHGENFTKP